MTTTEAKADAEVAKAGKRAQGGRGLILVSSRNRTVYSWALTAQWSP